MTTENAFIQKHLKRYDMKEEVEIQKEALRTEYEKGRADVISKLTDFEKKLLIFKDMPEIEFYELVEKMRKAQKEHLKTHSSEVLQESIRLEKQVDDAVMNFNALISSLLNEMGIRLI